MKIKSVFGKIHTATTAFSCFFGIAIFFIFSSTLGKFLTKALNLHVLPSYTGGEICGDFFDASNDDKGAGNLVYPSHSAFEAGSMDLIRYKVHEPVWNAKWTQNSEYWQLDLEYAAGPDFVRNTMIYIDLDNIQDGCSETLNEESEQVVIPSENAWDFAVWLSNGEGKVFNSKKEYICNTEYYVMENGRTVKIRIPLANKQLQKIFTAKKSYHYVLTGGFSQFDRGGFMPIEKRKSLSHGGVESSASYNRLIPKVYDVLGENSQLATWNAVDFTKAELVPVEVEMKAAKIKNSSKNEISDFVLNTKDNYYALMREKGNQGFGDDLDAAEQKYAKLLKENPEDYVAMANYGSLIAMKGGRSSVMQAVAYVNKAFEYLDKACILAYGNENEMEVLLNRGSVCASVPEQVFHQSEKGAEDFMRLAMLEKDFPDSDKTILTYYYVMSYECYLKAGKETEALLALQLAKKVIE